MNSEERKIQDGRVKELNEIYYPGKIAEILGIPRKKVYSVLKRLNISIKHTDPERGKKGNKASKVSGLKRSLERRSKDQEDLKDPVIRVSIVRDYQTKEVAEIIKGRTWEYKEITQLLKEEGVELKFRGRKPLDPTKRLTEEQIQLILGSTLGDMTIRRKARNANIAISHSTKQRALIEEKYDLLKSWIKNPLKTCIRKPHPETGKRYKDIHFGTRTHEEFNKWFELFYDSEGLKRIPLEVLDRLDERGLAWWFADDGSVGETQCVLCTDNFSISEVNRTKEWFEKRWGLIPTIVYNRKGQPRLLFSGKSSIDFISLVQPHLPMGVKHKVPENLRDLFNPHWREIVDYVKKHSPNQKIKQQPLDLDSQKVLFELFRRNGFPYISLTEEQMGGEVYRLRNDHGLRLINGKERTVRHSRAGMQLLNYFFVNLYDSSTKGRLSVREAFEKDDMLRKAIGKRFKYTSPPYPSIILRRLILMVNSPSNYPPLTAKSVYNFFLPSEGGIVYDPCAGYGGRALGALTCGKVKSYYGVDVNNSSINNSRKMRDTLLKGEYITEEEALKLNLMNVPAEDYIPQDPVDLVFTSPPYFDWEHYDKNGVAQVHNRCKTIEDYRSWVHRVMENCMKNIKPNAHIAIQLSDVGQGKKRYPIIEIWRGVLSSLRNLKLEESFAYSFPSSPSKGKKEGCGKEQILVAKVK